LQHFIKKSLLLSCSLFLFGCATSNQAIERKNYHSWENDIGYSQVVKTDNTLYISGITSEETTFENQIDDIYNTIKKYLLIMMLEQMLS